ncbi:MAG TPA: hypothetical protein DCS07_12145 [Bdellovibrionales bacterium]|nr:MAG: hypothetical protein A2Z97_02075 [Bdellovibrionales bacterium GWB1_52_6]OFZ03766.1 MAG: hypothetical protein A2X97_14535 [Bdellovibrionales bacterium GWA1_52_35]OFZ41786.1 MAG: hypothetical protein A2070_09310 [Bdellovibrionales bacterium GWC1_52_8]HAR43360.1 hypothetical protein [Bdellovibrionales bacterium]HCM38717.1 hypothetical protein [Bdellovibrionales bacterium]
MTTNDNITIVRKLYDCINEHDLECTLPLAHEKVEWCDMSTGIRLRGKDGFKQSNQNWLSAFPDVKIVITNIFATDEFVVAEYLAKGTHSGTLKTSVGQFESTRRQMEMNFCDVIHLENGKITSGHSYYDFMTLLNQIGVSVGSEMQKKRVA